MNGREEISARADVLVIGGGPAGCSAAIAAAERGAEVLLVDKGYCGTSGAAASAGVGIWYVPPDPVLREEAMASREALGGWLMDRDWMGRVLDETYLQVDRLAGWGYQFPIDDAGNEQRISLQGPEHMRLMRRQVRRMRVTIWDHSPALELVSDPDRGVVGALGVRRQAAVRWRVSAGAVVLATGGCGFRSGGMGCNVLTGDGHLFAAEVGAELSGMEFSNAYAIAPTFSAVTKTAIYTEASFTYEDGTVIEGAGSARGRSVIARTLLKQPVYCRLDGWPENMERTLRNSQPNFFLSFDRHGIDPFRERFPITLRLEGTIRGTGGLRIADHSCQTTVPGLFAAGDISTRELICGAFTGGGSHNAAWAVSSGTWAGRAAALHSKQIHRGSTRGRSAGGVGLRPLEHVDPTLSAADVVHAVQSEVMPYDRNYFRDAERLRDSRSRLDDLWQVIRNGLGPSPETEIGNREAAAMTAHARWMYLAALTRPETRGMHKRVDQPSLDPRWQRRLLVGGLDNLWTTFDTAFPHPPHEPDRTR
jgi:succinate dehydrogenase/fumarate reductase flavoprotein subunit